MFLRPPHTPPLHNIEIAVDLADCVIIIITIIIYLFYFIFYPLLREYLFSVKFLK